MESSPTLTPTDVKKQEDLTKVWMWLILKANKDNCQCPVCQKLREVTKTLFGEV